MKDIIATFNTAFFTSKNLIIASYKYAESQLYGVGGEMKRKEGVGGEGGRKRQNMHAVIL